MLTASERLPGRGPRTFGRDPRTHIMVRDLGLETAQATLVIFFLVGTWAVGRPSLLVGMRASSQ